MKVLIFLGFLLVYFLYLFAVIYFQKRILQNIKYNNFLNEALALVISNALAFCFIFIIGNFFNLKLLLFTTAALCLGLIITYLLWALIGSPRVPYRSVGAWAGSNIGFEYTITVNLFQLGSLAILIIYPIAMGIIFFNSSYAIEQVRILAFRYTIVLALAGYLITIPLIFGVLTAGYIDEDSRARYLVGNLTNIISLAIFISLFFWLYNIGQNSEVLFNIGNISFIYSPQITLVLIAYLLFFILLPYAIGYNKSKQLSKEYLSSSRRLLKKIKDDIQLAPIDNISNVITESKAILIGRFERLHENNVGVRLGFELESDEKPNTVEYQKIFEWYEEAKAYDKRFIFYDWLENLYTELEKLEFELNEQDNNQEKLATLKKFTSHFDSKHEELVEKTKEEKNNHKLWIGIFAILSPILSAIISEIGNLIINFFKELI